MPALFAMRAVLVARGDDDDGLRAVRRVLGQAVDQSAGRHAPALHIALDLDPADPGRPAKARLQRVVETLPNDYPHDVAVRRMMWRPDAGTPVLKKVALALADMERRAVADQQLKPLRVSWEALEEIADNLAANLKQTKPDLIVGLGRGSLAFAAHLSHHLRAQHFGVMMVSRFSEPDAEPVILGAYLPDASPLHVVIVDDVASEGKTLRAASEAVRERYPSNPSISYAVAYMDKHLHDRFRGFGPVFGAKVFDRSRHWVSFPWEVAP